MEQFAEQKGKTPFQINEILQEYYGGYRFSDRNIRVCNPFSVLKSLNEQAFQYYWSEITDSAFALNFLKENHHQIPRSENLIARDMMITGYEIDRPDLAAPLYQNGYITIRDIEDGIYTLSYPNQEMKIRFHSLKENSLSS